MQFLNRCVKYAPWMVLLYVYVRVALLLTNYNVVWAQMEELNWREYILSNGISLTSDDWTKPLNWQVFEYAPRCTRPLSSYVETLDTKLRAALWKVMVPHPSLSITWILSLLITPWLFFRLLRNLEVDSNIAILATALYVGNPGTLS